MIVSKLGNISEIIKSVNVTNSDIKLNPGFVPKVVIEFEIVSRSKPGLTLKNTSNVT